MGAVPLTFASYAATHKENITQKQLPAAQWDRVLLVVPHPFLTQALLRQSQVFAPCNIMNAGPHSSSLNCELAPSDRD